MANGWTVVGKIGDSGDENKSDKGWTVVGKVSNTVENQIDPLTTYQPIKFGTGGRVINGDDKDFKNVVKGNPVPHVNPTPSLKEYLDVRSQFETEEEFKQAVASAEYFEIAKNNPNQLLAEIRDLESQKRGLLQGSVWEQKAALADGSYAKKEKEINAEIFKRQQAYNLAQRLAKITSVETAAKGDVDFEKYVTSGEEKYKDLDKNVEKAQIKMAYATPATNNYTRTTAELKDYQELKSIQERIKLLTEDERKIFYYYAGKNSEQSAMEYLKTLEDTLNQRAAAKIAKNFKGDTAGELGFGVIAGLDQFGSGIKNLFNTKDDYIAPSKIQYASGMIRDDLADSGFKLPDILGGASVGQVAYDSITTTSNMLPSILASTAVGLLNPVAGEITGAVLLGGSAAGNAYQEALSKGYTKGQARTYSTLVGVSEATLQYVLGGVGKLGGKLSKNAVIKAVSQIDNGIAKFALKFGGAFGSEALEEGLQEFLTPLFENMVLGYDVNKLSDTDWGQVAYSALLGGLSGGLFEGGSAVSSSISEAQNAKVFKSLSNEGVETLINNALAFEKDSKAYQLAEYYKKRLDSGKKISGTQLFELAYEVGVTVADLQSGANNSVTDNTDNAVFHDPKITDIAEELDPNDKYITKDNGYQFKDSRQRHIEKVSDKFGIKVIWKEDVSRGKYIPSKKMIVLNPNMRTSEMYNFVFKHEFTHYLEGKQGYDGFKKYCFSDSPAFEKWVRDRLDKSGISSTGSRGEVIQRLTKISFDVYKNSNEISMFFRNKFTMEDAEAEVLADFVGESLLGTGEHLEETLDMLNDLNHRHRGIFERIRDFVRDMINRFKGNSKFKGLVSDLEYLNERLKRVAESDNKKIPDNVTEKYSIEYTTDNKPVAVIDENILDGVPKSQWVQTVKNTIAKKFSSGIPISGRLIKVNKITRSEYTNSKYSKYLKSSDGTIYQDKLKTANNLDDIVLASTNYINEDLKHSRNDSFKEFARGDVLIRVSGNDYSAKVIVGFTNSQQMVLYDVIDFNQTSFKIKERTSRTAMQNAGSDRNVMSYDITVPQKAQSVKNNISENTENDTEKNSIVTLPIDELLDKYDRREITREEYLKETDSMTRRAALQYVQKWERENGILANNGDVTQEEISKINSLAWAMSEKYGFNAESEEISKKLIEFYKYTKTTRSIFSVEEHARKLASELAQFGTTGTIPTPEAKSILKDMRTSKICLSEEQKNSVAGEFGSYDEYRKELFGKLIISNKGEALSDLWKNWSNKYPDIFDKNISSEKIPLELKRIVDNLRKTYDIKSAMYEIADELVNFCVLNNTRFAEEKRMRILETEREEQQMRKDRESNIGAIRRTVRKLDHALRANTNAKHIPEAYKNVVTGFCKLFVDNDKATFEHKELADIYAYYSSMKGDDETIPDAPHYDPYIDELLKSFIDTLSGRKLTELNNLELNYVRTVTDALNYTVDHEAQVLIDGKKAKYDEVGRAALNDIENANPTKLIGALKKENVEKIREFFYEGNMLPGYFLKRMGGTFEKVFNDFINGENKWARNMEISRKFVDDVKSKYDYAEWKDTTVSFRTESGHDITITIDQAMQLVATAQRERSNNGQKAKHLSIGGVVIDIKAIKDALKKQRRKKADISAIWDSVNNKAIQISFKDADVISTMLTDAEKGYIKEIVDFLSTQCAAWGNEVTMEQYGYRQFNESNYFPYVSSELFLTRDPAKAESTILRRASFTHSLQKNANNPLILTSFTDIALQHIESMCNFNAMTVPLETLNKIFNYKTESNEDVAPRSVKAEMKNVFGNGAVEYMQNLINDLNTGVRGDQRDGFLNKWISRFKKNAVLANLSVIVQQPWAVLRATSDINVKYFAAATKYLSNNNYEECKQYAPVAIIKQMGRFDTGVGVKNTTWLSGEKTFFEKADDALGWGAGKADEIAWSFLWSSVKAEIADTTNLKVGSEEFLIKAGERFTELVNKTQVYDSVLTKSQNMRNKGLVGAITSFAGEPTVSLNMLADSFLDFTEGKIGGKQFARVITAVTTAEIVTAIAQSLVTAARDDDEDKSYLEKYLKNVVANSLSNVNLAGKIPFIRDLMSIWEGYDIERQDVALFADFLTAVKTLANKNKTWPEKIRGISEALAALYGVPLKNVLRDIEATVKTIQGFVIGKEKTDADGVKVSLLEGISENNILKPLSVEFFDFSKSGEYERMAKAAKRGDEDTYSESYNRLIKNGAEDSEIRTGITNEFKSDKTVKKQSANYNKELKQSDTFNSFSDDDKEKLSGQVTSALAKEVMVKATEREPDEYDRLYDLYRNNKPEYKKLKEQMLEEGKTKRQIEDGFEIARYAYLKSVGIDLHEYLLYKMAISEKYADKDNSGGVSYAEKKAVIDNMDIDEETRQLIRNVLLKK